MMRRCLDCGELIATGPRCRACAHNRRPAWARTVLPRETKARDGGRCVRCGSTDRIQAHHIIPVDDGGPHTLANTETLCHHCHVEETRRLKSQARVAFRDLPLSEKFDRWKVQDINRHRRVRPDEEEGHGR